MTNFKFGEVASYNCIFLLFFAWYAEYLASHKWKLEASGIIKDITLLHRIEKICIAKLILSIIENFEA